MNTINNMVCFKPEEINTILQTNSHTNSLSIYLIIAASLGFLVLHIPIIRQLNPKDRFNKLIEIFPVFIILCVSIFLLINKPEVTIYG